MSRCSLKKQYALCLSDSYCCCVFLIQQSYGECVKDTGWFVVLDPFLTPPDCCKWSDLPEKPKFVYSMDDNMTTFQDGRKNYILIHISKSTFYLRAIRNESDSDEFD